MGWLFALRHSQFASSLGLWWIRSYGMTLHWGTIILESIFIGDTVVLLDILHRDTLHSLMIDFWDDGFFKTQLLQRLHVLRHKPLIDDGLWFILEHSHFRWFILGYSYFIHIHIAWGFWFIWIMLRCFRFGTRSRDWLICWHTLAWFSSAMVDSDALLYDSCPIGVSADSCPAGAPWMRE